MKILQVITSLRIGGAEKLVVDMAPLLKAKGHVVDVFIFDGTETPFLRQLEDGGIHVILYNHGASMYDPRNILKLKKLIPQYDIVHTHNTSSQYYVAFARNFSKSNRVRFITTEHSTSNRRRESFLFRYLDQWMYQQYDSIVSISDKATINLQKSIGVGFEIKTIYNGIDLQKFINAEALDRDLQLKKETGFYIISMVAGFRAEKDQDTLIKALKYLPEKCKLWLIGDGERRLICEDLVQSMDLSDKVVFAGIRTDIPKILKASDVIVMSSHWEGLSLSSIEGMSVGKPFVASDVDGLHEIVDGYGILFPHQNEKALADDIMELMNKPDYAEKVAKKCFEKACQYDISKTVDAYLDVYKNVAR